MMIAMFLFSFGKVADFCRYRMSYTQNLIGYQKEKKKESEAFARMLTNILMVQM